MARMPTELTIKEKAAAVRLAESLSAAFPWHKTPNGEQYWREVKRNLMSLVHYKYYAYDPETNNPGFVAVADEPEDVIFEEMEDEGP